MLKTRSRLIKWLAAVLAVLALALGAAVAIAADSGGSSAPETRTSAPQQTDGAHPWIGVWPARAEDGKGLAVRKVFDPSPAKDAGLERGDVITAVDGQAVARVRELLEAIKDKQPGDQITLAVIKNGVDNPDAASADVNVTLGERPGRGEIKQRIRDRLSEKVGDLLGGDFLGGEFRIRDKDGNVVTYSVDAGKVKSASETELKIEANDGSGEKGYSIGADTHMPKDFQEGDQVIVVSVNGEVKWVVGGGFGGMFGKFGGLRGGHGFDGGRWFDFDDLDDFDHHDDDDDDVDQEEETPAP